MKKYILAAALFAAPAAAKELPPQSVVCLTQAQVDEAWKAVERDDLEWLRSVPGCFATTTALKAERIDCSGRACRARVWDTTGASRVMYTFRAYL